MASGERIAAETQRIASIPPTEQEKEEFKRCLNDPVYFLKNYIYIRTPYGKELFPLRKRQEEAARILWEDKFVYVLKSRQVGFTTLVLAMGLWAFFFWDSNIVLVEPTLDKAKEKFKGMIIPAVVDILQDPEKRFIFKFFPLKYASELLQKVTGTKYFPTGPTTGTRGETVDIVILDEYQSLPNANEFLSETYPTFTTTLDAYVKAIKKVKEGQPLDQRELVILRKPFGLWIVGTGGVIGHPRYPNAEMAARHWEAAISGEGIGGTNIRLTPFRYHWSEVFDEETKRSQMQMQSMQHGIPIELIEVEEELKFVDISELNLDTDTLFTSHLFEYIKRVARNGIIEKEEYSQRLSDRYMEASILYFVPKNILKGFYTIWGVDVSSGLGDDYTAITVIDAFSLMQLVEVKAKMLPFEAVNLTIDLINRYFDRYKILKFVVERHRGEEYISHIINYFDNIGLNWNKIVASEESPKSSKWLPGIRLNSKGKKRRIVEAIRAALGFSKDIIRSPELAEVMEYIDFDTLKSVKSTIHDDIFSSWAMAIYGSSLLGLQRLQFRASPEAEKVRAKIIKGEISELKSDIELEEKHPTHKLLSRGFLKWDEMKSYLEETYSIIDDEEYYMKKTNEKKNPENEIVENFLKKFFGGNSL